MQEMGIRRTKQLAQAMAQWMQWGDGSRDALGKD